MDAIQRKSMINAGGGPGLLKSEGRVKRARTEEVNQPFLQGGTFQPGLTTIGWSPRTRIKRNVKKPITNTNGRVRTEY